LKARSKTVSECEAREFLALAGAALRRDAEDFGKQTATVELRCDHDNPRSGKGGSRYWVCVHLGNAE